MFSRPKLTREMAAIVVAACVLATLVIVAPVIAVIASIVAAIVLGAILIIYWPRQTASGSANSDKDDATRKDKQAGDN
jgi:uncharacterized RDD family membrane protein YckC